MTARFSWPCACGAAALAALAPFATAWPATALTEDLMRQPVPAAASTATTVTAADAALHAAAKAGPLAPADAAVAPAPTLAIPAVVQPVKLDLSHATDVSNPTALFPRPPILRPAIAFWTDIFGKYSENQSVVHSMDDVSKVYMVLDFRDQAATLNPVRLEHVRDAAEREAKAHVIAMLRRCDALQATPDRLTPEEHRIFDLYADSHDPRRFREAINAVRIQRGLKERTEQAMETATRYLPQMERVFASYGLPAELTRLPLVESSFNVDAYSRSGAAGIWQFIPSSARIYMRLDDVVDDRRDIWFSTDAAARHLRDDYDALRNWPLAVTAYNHGRGGLARGLIAVQGTTLSDLLTRWHNPNFGFASRNYYAEFLAASDVDRAWRAQHPLIGSRGDTLHYDVVTLHDYLPYETVRALTGLDEDSFRALNPSYSEEVVSGKLYIPPGHDIRVPAGTAAQFMTAYDALPESERFTHQRLYYTAYRVQRGDTLGRLARRYGVSTSAILAANGLRAHTPIHIGQTLKIPPHRDGGVVATRKPRLVAVSQKSGGEEGGYRLHRIEAGQTLREIAHRYRTSVDELMQLNALTDARRVRAGTLIKIPAVE